MIEGLEIRPARLGDEVSFQANCKIGATLEQVRQQIECTAQQARDGVMAHLVADLKGEVIGGAMLLAATAHLMLVDNGVELCAGRGDRAPVSGRFDDWVVTERYAGQGVGRALFFAAADLARTWGWQTLETSTQLGSNADYAFRSFGLTEWGRIPRSADYTEVFFWMTLDEVTS